MSFRTNSPGGEHATDDYLAFDAGKPNLHPITPGEIRRREMQLHAGCCCRKGLPSSRLVAADRLSSMTWASCFDLQPPTTWPRKLNELLAGMVRRRPPPAPFRPAHR